MVANMMLLTNDLHKLVQFLIFPKGGGARIGAPPPAYATECNSVLFDTVLASRLLFVSQHFTCGTSID